MELRSKTSMTRSDQTLTEMATKSKKKCVVKGVVRGDVKSDINVTKKELTILMIGETGVGKSTFINALVNYLMFDSIDDAAKDLQCIIPTSFAVYDESSNDMKECTFGDSDENEGADKTESRTQACRCYKQSFTHPIFVESGDVTLKIIDTPGIADSRGVDRDMLNLKRMLSFLSNYKELNAICVLMKPNNARVDVLFKYCILELLTHLNKSAAENIIFTFTNSRGTFYKPGDTAGPLDKILQDVLAKPPHVEIKFNQENYFCFDSEAFRYLVAKSEPNNVEFDSSAHADFEKSWQRSVTECQRLFKRIYELKPHAVQDTISVNDIRTKIMNLRKPIALITENISNEIGMCELHEKKIEQFAGDVKDLEKELYTPALDIVSDPLDQPITVCSHPDCCEKNSLGNTVKIHYKSICHKPCYLDKSDDNIIGNAGLLDCRAFNRYETYGEGDWYDPKRIAPDTKFECNVEGNVFAFASNRTKSENCFKCVHSYQTHLTINYETKIVKQQIRDENKFKRIESNLCDIDRRQIQIQEIQKRVHANKDELQFITECAAYFARFLMNNTITPFNDALKDYIKCCIANEQKGNANAVVIKGYEDMLEAYNREKETIEKLSEKTSGRSNLSSAQIYEKMKELFNLTMYGKVIKYHMELEAEGRRKTRMALEKNIEIGTADATKFSACFQEVFSKFKFW